MNKLFSTLFSSIRAKFTSLWTRLRLWLSPTYWRTRGFTKLRQGFSRLFDIRPRSQKDYYGIFRWLVSKRLAFAVVVVLGVLCVFYIVSTLPALDFGTSGGIRTYKYNAIPLKFYSGQVRILDKHGCLAYEGQVEKAQCEGSGVLYDEEGNTVYRGQFANSMFNGNGTSYYRDGTTQYEGEFVDNLYSGTGSYYRPTGVMEYAGGYTDGLRAGEGTLYNSAGTQIFSGSFQKGQIVYSEFLEKDTATVAQMYTGQTQIYNGDGEYCVSMTEIGAVYAVADGGNSLEENWTVNGIFVLSDSLYAEGQNLRSVNQITAAFGQPDYFGITWVNLPEAVALNLQADRAEGLGKVAMTATESFDDVYAVEDYDKDFQLYIYSYQREGLLYTFYCTDSGVDSFFMYAIELA